MNAPSRLLLFGAGLAVVFAIAAGVGGAIGPDSPVVTAQRSGSTDGHGGHSEAPTAGQPPEVPGGLQSAEQGYRLVLDHASAKPGTDVPVRFRVIGPDNTPLRSYTRAHDEDLHLIAVRRDLTGYQHVHPELGADGTWSTALDLTAGSWRVFADFDPAGQVAGLILGTDLHVSGSFAPQPLPAAAATSVVDGYTVALTGALMPGRESELTLSVARNGTPVTDLQPYLAAYGHLVALREGDLAYLHVHPEGAPADGHTRPGPDIRFLTTAPSAGTYRVFLDFQHRGTVRTAEFTTTAGERAPSHGH